MWIHAQEVEISQHRQNDKKVKMSTFNLKIQSLNLTNYEKYQLA